MNVLLYDFERDGHIREGESIIVYEDGTTERIKTSKLYKKVGNGEQQQQPTRRRYFRGRPAGTIKRRKTHARQAPPRKRTPLRKT